MQSPDTITTTQQGQDQYLKLRQELQTWKARALDAERRALSRATLQLAHRALLEMRAGVIPWAALNDCIDSEAMLELLDAAVKELRAARGL